MNYNDFRDKTYLKKLLALQANNANQQGGRSVECVNRHAKWLISELFNNSSDLRFLDLGCGIGHYTRVLAQHGHHGVGVDISELAINYAINMTPDELPCKFTCADMFTCSLPEKNDVVIIPYSMLNLVDHKTNQALFKAICGSLVKGGKLYLEIIASPSPKKEIEYFTWESDGDEFYSNDAYLCVVKQVWEEANNALTCHYRLVDQKTHAYSYHEMTCYQYDAKILSKMLMSAGFREVEFLSQPPGAEVDQGLDYLYLQAVR